MNKSVFVYVTGCNNWILKIIADDIYRELSAKGITCRLGTREEYQNESIVYHMWWRIASPIKTADVNSVFITHTDDALKEHDLLKMRDSFSSFITMSDEDALFLIGLGFEKQKVYGLNLPVRNKYVRPLSIGIFSNCYPDYRKNEKWLLDYCKANELTRLVNFVFIGDGWADFIKELHAINCTFEWHFVSREFPYEYIFQQMKLMSIDYYLYMGMDGGAMGTYDAYAMGVSLCVSDDGYHKGIPDVRCKFDNYRGFEESLDSIISEHKRKIDFFNSNNVANYVDRLFDIWNNTSKHGQENVITNESIYNDVVTKRRVNYFSLTPSRIKQWVSSILWRKRIV